MERNMIFHWPTFGHLFGHGKCPKPLTRTASGCSIHPKPNGPSDLRLFAQLPKLLDSPGDVRIVRILAGVIRRTRPEVFCPSIQNFLLTPWSAAGVSTTVSRSSSWLVICLAGGGVFSRGCCVSVCCDDQSFARCIPRSFVPRDLSSVRSDCSRK